MNSDRAVVDIHNVSRTFGDTTALSGVCLQIREKSLTGLIGADGAGKTTLMRICTTLDQQYEGAVAVLGLSTSIHKKQIRNRIGYMPQRFSLYSDLTVQENLSFFADVYTLPADIRRTRIERLLAFSRLEPFVDRKAGNLSGGMKQKLALSCALIHEPEVLLLDEPTVGVDPLSRQEFWSILHDLHKNGTTIILSTPYMDEVEYCEDIVLLHQGTVLQTGTPREMIDDYPYKLYIIYTCARIPDDLTLPQGIVHVYTTGGSVRIVADRQMSLQKVQDKIGEIFPGEKPVQPVRPDFEDVFIHALTP